ncbi:MAG: folate-dependent phosphoribosylglycinamide formyltransferase [Anaerocolumna sp.]|jgi:phosphoribosylglycinamide formyltransferase-1|nr:folate-dependent phosphoribosylglycinamide formyltransferase [Anaerocolumna sp.]
MLKIAVLVSGGGTNLQAIIDHIQDGNIKNTKIQVVISNKNDAFALERASNNHIPSVVISPKDYDSKAHFGNDLMKELEKYTIDLIVLAGYLVILPTNLIRAYNNRIINIHPSLIPSFCGDGYYGLKVHEGVLHRGVKVTGATVHFVDEGTDTGPIIIQKAVDVLDGDTPLILQKRVMEEAEQIILPKAINLIAMNRIQVQDNNVIIIS